MDTSGILDYLRELEARRALEGFLARRQFLDPYDPDYLLTPRTRRLCLDEGEVAEEEGDEEVQRIFDSRPLAVVMAIPSPPSGMLIKPTDNRIWEWLDVAERRYPPEEGIGLLRSRPKAMMGGVIMADQRRNDPSSLRSYLAVEWSGVVEFALAFPIATVFRRQLIFLLTPLVGRCWQMLGFVGELYRTYSCEGTFTLVIGIRSAAGSMLGGLAEGWRSPFNGFFHDDPRCTEPGIRVRRDHLLPTMTDTEIADLVRELAVEVEACWQHGGPQHPPRCYIRSRDERAGCFDVRKFSQLAR